MDAFRRASADTLLARLAEPPNRLIAISGPRQVGKTTMVHQALARTDRPGRYLAVDEPPPSDPGLVLSELRGNTAPLTDERDPAWVVRTWEDARRRAWESPHGLVLVYDEIQKIHDWPETIKGLWDADRANDVPLHVVVLGSAPLLMQSGLSESLAGRFEPIRMTHWAFSEIAAAFDLTLDEYIYFGGYPGAAALIRDEARWRDYILHALVEPHLERDLLAMTRVDKPALLKNLFALGASHSGQILSYNKMLGQLHDAGNTTTLARYLDLLSSAGLLTGLSQHSGSTPRRRASSPKLNVLNTALMTAASGYSFDEARADRTFWGRLVESAVGAHLVNTASASVGIHYWRDGRHEIDFVLRRGPRVVGIEVKSGERRANEDAMRAFQQRFGAPRPLVVGEEGVPLNEFLSTPADEWLGEP
ncbi:MAG: ATP-binding protein [Gammaproteobacteria bacterium]|nr:ATP-binding protein [Gammaproteobacteria bacterium]